MHACLDDLVIALYVTVDELLGPRHGPGRPPRLSDSELVCLAIAQVMLGYRSERRWLRAVNARLGHLFPYVCGQAAYNRRLRRAAPLVASISHALAVACPSWCDSWRLLDATPVPCGASRQTVRRSDLAGWAGYGYDRSHSRWYWGLKLYLLACPDGMPVAWCLANPTIGERQVAESLLDQAARRHVLRPGLVILADKGLAGRAFTQVVAELDAVLVRPDRADEPARFGNLGGVRQWIEAIIDTLKDQLSLEQHGAHTVQGVWIRVAQRLLALATAVWFNWQLGAPVKRSLVAYDH
ncbi:MAG: IS982 family transposase [Acidimicrobiales bacterium]